MCSRDVGYPQRVLSQVEAFAKAKGLSMYLVGGIVREALLGATKDPTNIDFAIATGALVVAKELAIVLRGTYICLDEEAGSARIVVSEGAARVALDLSDFRGRGLEGDLARRDFTINAMAVPLSAWTAGSSWRAQLIDPLEGQAALRRKVLVACYDETFADDPVRILRAFRFAALLGFTLEASLAGLMARAAPGIRAVAGERVRDELFAIFQTDRAAWVLYGLDACGALQVLFPELMPGRDVGQGDFHHLDVLGHQLETVAQCDRILRDFKEFSQALQAPLTAYCATDMVDGRSRKAVIKLASLLHDVGKPATKRVKPDGDIWFLGHEQFGAMLVVTVAERLRLSNREGQTFQELVLSHLRPGYLSRERILTPRAIFRFFRDLGEDGPACLLVWWADRMATRGPSSRLDQIDQQRARLEELIHAYFFRAEEVVKPPRLIDGNQLMATLGMKPGPTIGRLLRAIEEGQAVGQIHTVEEALALARSTLEADGGSPQ